MADSNPRIPYRLSTDEPRLAPLAGKRLVCHVVVNIEHWPFAKPMPRKLLQAPHGKDPWPDVPNFSWVEYGLRQGMPRIARALAERGIPASAAMNASVVDVYPACAELVLKSGWEFVGHGFEQRSLQSETDEAAVIAKSVARLASFSGRKVRGWLGPGLAQTEHTADHLKACGIDHCYDWVLDDVPVWMRTKHGPMVAVPYTLETNDVPIFAIAQHDSPVFFERVRDTVEALGPELGESCRVVTLALHPHIIAVPHRFKYFVMALDYLQRRGDSVFVTGSQMCDWFTAQCPAPADGGAA